MPSREEHLMAWLRDAHAMEKQAETMLSAMAGRIENYPDVKTKIEAHLAETSRQADMLQSCIERRGGDTSTLKDLMGKFMAMGQGMSGAFVDDEIVKGSMASYTFEQMEIAAYKVLIAAAEACSDPETSAVCQRILQEEEAMAKWLAENLPGVTEKFLARAEMPDITAKH
jgi:ferritin-like metal-binding protein YciE